jgi:hypothetical protein
MAEFTTLIFPTDKDYVPTDEAIARVTAHLDELYLGHYEPTPKKHRGVSFLDSGAAFDRFTCPACGSTVRMHDPDGRWYACNWHDITHEDQPVTVPCCSASVPFRDLGVSERTGFATFHFEIEGAGEDYLPNEEQFLHIGELLGCKVRHLISVLD